MKILIVDDDRTNLLVLSSMLKKEGYTTIEATNGLEAVELFRQYDVDMVLMDVMMPEMDGYQAAKEIKAKSGESFVPIIFLTAITEDKALAKCVENGGDDFLTKPYNRIILRSKIDALNRIKELYGTLQKQRNKLKELNNKIENDIELANHVYKSLVKTNLLPNGIFKTWLSPVSTFNGDIALVTQTLSGGYHVMLGDFTGHGMAASLGTIPVCDIFNGMTRRGYKISDIVTEINQKLKYLLPTGYFCAAAFASIDNDGRTLNIVNAGLPPIIIKYNDHLEYINSKHLPIGIVDLSPKEIEFNKIDISENVKVCIYSDGLIESKNPNGELFGQQRLQEIISNSVNIVDDIEKEISSFTVQNEQEDDISFVEISMPFKEIMTDKKKITHSYEWCQSYLFDYNTLSHSDPVMIVLDAIMSNKIPSAHKDRIYTIVTELFNNSLEHGLLQINSDLKSTPEGFSEYYIQRMKRLENLDAGSISIKVENIKENCGGRLIFTIADTGEGFDYFKFIDGKFMSNIYSGRGIMLVKSICEKLEYSNNGSEVHAEYLWDYE